MHAPTAHAAIRWLLYATALVPIIFLADFFYPFIVPRTVFFRVLIELALVAGVWVWWKGGVCRAFRGGVYITLALGAFVLVNILAGVFGIAPIYSLYGDLERSWGLYTIVHVLLFYMLARSFFLEKQWLVFSRFVAGSSVFVAVYGIVQRYAGKLGIEMIDAGASRIPSTLGNPAYTAMVLIFGMVFTVYAWSKSARSYRSERYVYGLLFIIQLVAFGMTDIRGAYLGVLAGLVLGLVVYAATSVRKKVKILVAGILVAGILLGVLSFSFRETAFVRHLPVVGRLSTISAGDATAATRLIGWRAALKGFNEAPILGVGLENFGYVFNKHFDPAYYTYASSEPYFDRAHNNLLDILATSGMLGLVSYMALVAAAGYCLWAGYKKGRFSRFEAALFAGLLSAYSVHMFFVFDDLSAILYFFAFLALIEYKYTNSVIPRCAYPRSRRIYVGIAAALLAMAIGYFGILTNVRILRASGQMIDAVVFQSRGQLQEAGDAFKKAFALSESIPRKAMLNPYTEYVLGLANAYAASTDPELKELFSRQSNAILIILAEERRKNPHDPILLTKTANIHTANYVVERSDIDRQTALAYIAEAIKLSPDRPQYYNLLAESYVLFGEPEKAVEAAEASLALNQDYQETYKYLVNSYMSAAIAALREGREADAIRYAEKSAEYDPMLQSEVEYIVREIRAGRSSGLIDQLMQ